MLYVHEYCSAGCTSMNMYVLCFALCCTFVGLNFSQTSAFNFCSVTLIQLFELKLFCLD